MICQAESADQCEKRRPILLEGRHQLRPEKAAVFVNELNASRLIARVAEKRDAARYVDVARHLSGGNVNHEREIVADFDRSAYGRCVEARTEQHSGRDPVVLIRVRHAERRVNGERARRVPVEQAGDSFRDIPDLLHRLLVLNDQHVGQSSGGALGAALGRYGEHASRRRRLFGKPASESSVHPSKASDHQAPQTQKSGQAHRYTFSDYQVGAVESKEDSERRSQFTSV